MKEDDVPAGSTNGLSQVEVPLVARKAMKQHDGRMGPRPLGLVDDRIQERSVDDELDFYEKRGCSASKVRKSSEAGP